MKKIWAPWRIEYIRGEKSGDCIFCRKSKENDDRDNYILFRGAKNFIIMNAYPYNPGHLMVTPYRHLSNIEKLTDEEMLEHFKLVRKCTRALTKTYQPDGFNIGINMGKAAGAGIADHIHTHIVPRWGGDTNYITVVSDIRVIPEALDATYAELKERLDSK